MTTKDPALPAVGLPAAGPLHYQALCGLCLGMVFLTQLQQGLLLSNLLAVMVGVLGLTTRVRFAPLLFLILVGCAQILHQVGPFRQVGLGQDLRRPLDVMEFFLCAAVLGYVVGQYRLNSIQGSLLPVDPRQRTGLPRWRFPWFGKSKQQVEEKRPGGQITPWELAWFVLSLPLWALVAHIVAAVLGMNWELLDWSPRVVRLVLSFWALALGFLAARLFFAYWKYRQRDAQLARMFLQETLWQETRGDQRRISRWLAWRRLENKIVGGTSERET